MKNCRPTRHLWPGTGESLEFFFNTDPIFFVLFFSILYLMYQRGYQRQYFWTLYLKVLAYEAATA